MMCIESAELLLTVMAPVPSFIQSLKQPLAERGVFGAFVTSKMLAMRPMKVTGRGPGHRSRISTSAYSIAAHQDSLAFDSKALWTSSAVKPSPTTESEDDTERGWLDEALDVAGKYACIEVPLGFACGILDIRQGDEVHVGTSYEDKSSSIS